MATSNWHSADFSQLAPEAVTEAISAISDVLDTVEAILTPAALGFSAIAEFFATIAADLSEAVRPLVESIRTDYLGTGYYHLPMWDFGVNQIRKEIATGENQSTTFNDFINKMSLTLTDELDEDRPKFTRVCRGFVVVAAGNSFEEFRDLFDSFVKLFPSDAEIKRIKELLDIFVDDVETVGKPKPYNWIDATSDDLLRTVAPPLADIIDQTFETALALLTAGASAATAISEIAKMVSKKVNKISDTVADLNDLTTSLNTILSASGLHCLYIESSNGVSGIKSALATASDKPYDGGIYVSGGMWVVGPAGAALFDSLFGNV